MDKKIISISLANPRGFCAGVDRAIEIVEQSLDKYGAPIYVRNEVVHNKFVIESLKKKGAIFVNDLKLVPENSYLIYSAHGVSKKVRSDADNYKLKNIDATCPLVTKVHKEVNHYLKNNYEIIMIGHKGHPEVEGTLGQDPTSKKMHLIEKISDIHHLNISDPNKIAYVTQTTLSLDETKEVIKELKSKFPMIEGPKADDICYATQNRQDAIKQILPRADILFVVGSKNSSNSNRLSELAEKCGCRSILIDEFTDIDLDDLKNYSKISITAGASAPESKVMEIAKSLELHTDAKIIEHGEDNEDIYFKLPPGLR